MAETARKIVSLDEKRRENLEERLNDVGTLNSYKYVSGFSEIKDPSKYKDYSKLETLGGIIGGEGQQALLVNSPDARINKEVDNYLGNEKRNKDVGEAIDRQKEFLLTEYIKFVNDEIAKEVEKIKDKISAGKNLSEEEKKNILDTNVKHIVYTIVGELLTNLYLNKDADNELKEAYDQLKHIRELKGDDLKGYARARIAKERGFAYDGEGLTISTGEKDINLWAGQYSRNIGKQFVEKTSNGYELNKDKLEKAFGNKESYLTMSIPASKSLNEYLNPKE